MGIPLPGIQIGLTVQRSIGRKPMSAPPLTIRTMTRQDLDLVIDWAAAEGWNPGYHDADGFYAADPRGFLLGVLDQEPIAALSAVRYGATFGFLGFYRTRPDFRGQGYGLLLWKAGFAHLQGRTIGLDGVVAQQENYQRSGFRRAYRHLRYQGVGGGPVAMQKGLVPLSTLPFETVCAYDQPFFPDDRQRFLRCWIHQPDPTAWGLQQAGQLVAYGVLRRCHSGYKIGPLFADRPEGAETLFLAMQAQQSAVLNIAGPRESQRPGVYEAACRCLESLLASHSLDLTVIDPLGKA